jgi:hypothetical protein
LTKKMLMYTFTANKITNVMSAADTTVITTRIDASLRAKLEALARSTRRSKIVSRG